jgi:hypothetical protein
LPTVWPTIRARRGAVRQPRSVVNPIVEPVPDALLFDTDSPCSIQHLLALKAIGFQGGIRTVTVDAAPDPSDITAQEVQDFMAAGLGLMLYQRVREPRWIPSEALGKADAEVFVQKAKRANYLQGASAWDDLEGIGGDANATIAYANEKANGLKTAKYVPGDYVGFDVPLTGDQLFHNLIVTCYWRSLSNVPDVAMRGYAMIQIAVNVFVSGIEVDVNLVRADRLGGRPFWMRNAS